MLKVYLRCFLIRFDNIDATLDAQTVFVRRICLFIWMFSWNIRYFWVLFLRALKGNARIPRMCWTANAIRRGPVCRKFEFAPVLQTDKRTLFFSRASLLKRSHLHAWNCAASVHDALNFPTSLISCMCNENLQLRRLCDTRRPAKHVFTAVTRLHYWPIKPGLFKTEHSRLLL